MPIVDLSSPCACRPADILPRGASLFRIARLAPGLHVGGDSGHGGTGPAITRNGASSGSIANGRTSRKRRPDSRRMVVLTSSRSEDATRSRPSASRASRPALVVSNVSFTYQTDARARRRELHCRARPLHGPARPERRRQDDALLADHPPARHAPGPHRRSAAATSARPARGRSRRSASSSSSRPSTSTSPSGRTCTISRGCAASRGRRRNGASSAS